MHVVLPWYHFDCYVDIPAAVADMVNLEILNFFNNNIEVWHLGNTVIQSCVNGNTEVGVENETLSPTGLASWAAPDEPLFIHSFISGKHL